MWTEAHRARHEAGLKEMISTCAAEELARWLARVDPPHSEKATPVLPVVSAIAWHLRVGGPWRALPGDFPAWRTVYGWFRRWLELGLFDRLLCDVAFLRRRAAGRKPEPSLGIVDTQSVKCIPVRGPRGYDAAKKVLGRKRVALVEADGTWLAIAVVPASTQERDTLPALDVGKAEWPSLREAVLDGGFVAERCRDWSNRHGMRHHVVQRDPGQKGFVVLERRGDGFAVLPFRGIAYGDGRGTQLRLARAPGWAAARPRRAPRCFGRPHRVCGHRVGRRSLAQPHANSCRRKLKSLKQVLSA
jgi:transposase